MVVRGLFGIYLGNLVDLKLTIGGVDNAHYKGEFVT